MAVASGPDLRTILFDEYAHPSRSVRAVFARRCVPGDSWPLCPGCAVPAPRVQPRTLGQFGTSGGPQQPGPGSRGSWGVRKQPGEHPRAQVGRRAPNKQRATRLQYLQQPGGPCRPTQPGAVTGFHPLTIRSERTWIAHRDPMLATLLQGLGSIPAAGVARIFRQPPLGEARPLRRRDIGEKTESINIARILCQLGNQP